MDQKLYEQIKQLERDDPEVLSTNMTRLLEKVKDEKFVVIGSFFYYHEYRYLFPNDSCDLTMTDTWEMNTMALAMQNNSAYKHYVNHFTMDMAEFGITQRLQTQAYRKVNCDRYSIEAFHMPVLFESVIPVFYVLFGFIFVSVIVLTCEVVFTTQLY